MRGRIRINTIVKLQRMIRHFGTRFEFAIWLAAVIVVITLGTLAVTNVLGSWALLLGSLICVAVGLMLSRKEMG
jgi:hypothetical protein